MNKPTLRTVEQKKTILEKIKELRKEGRSLAAACKDQDISPTNFYAWSTRKTRVGTTHAKTAVTGLNRSLRIQGVGYDGPYMVAVGSQRDVQEALDTFRTIQIAA